MSYSDKVIDHYNNPRNVGSMDKKDADVGTGLVGAPECGDVMKLQIKVNPQTNVIEDAKFKTFGCGSAIASSSLATEWVKGKTVDEALAIKNTEIVKELALPPVKIHCSVLAEDAIRAAIGDWKKKQEAANPRKCRRRSKSAACTGSWKRHGFQDVCTPHCAKIQSWLAALKAGKLSNGPSAQRRSRQTRRAHGSGQGHPGDRQRAQEDSLRHGEREHFAGAGRTSFGRAGRRMLGPELQHHGSIRNRASATVCFSSEMCGFLSTRSPSSICTG